MVNQRHCFEESGQWLKNVDRTHLVLASGKLISLNDVFFSVIVLYLMFRLMFEMDGFISGSQVNVASFIETANSFSDL